MIIDRYLIQKREDLFLQNVMHEMLGDTEPYDKDRFWGLIDKWKAYFTNELGLRKGDVVGLGLVKNNVNASAAIFALAECGAQVFTSGISWNKNCPVDYPASVLNASFGLWDSVTVRMTDSAQRDYWEDNLHYEMIQIDAIDIENYNEPPEIDYAEVLPDDPFWITNSDGQFEDNLEFQYWTHKQCWGIAHRQYKLFGHHDTLGVHTFNAVHCMSFILYSLPAFMGCKEHFFYNWWDKADMWKTGMVKALQQMYKRPINKVIWFKNEETLRMSLQGLTKDDFDGSTCQFVAPFGVYRESLHDLVEELGIKISVLYGETRSKSLPLFVKPVQGSFIKDSIGFVLDNYYECVYSAQKNVMFVRQHNDDEYYPLGFKVQKNDNGEYINLGPVQVNPYQKRVEAILEHNDFFLLRKNGLNYLALFEEPTKDQYKLLLSPAMGLTDIQVIDRMSMCLENTRYRDWFALKNQFEYGFESFEEDRVRYYNGSE